MRTYGKKYIRNKFRAAGDQRTESRDGVLWEILEEDRKCRVKIEGSSTYVIADYPENIDAKPSWMKPGNAVRIIHRGGLRGHIEVAQSGITRPGTGPTLGNPADCVMSGCQLKAAGDMIVLVQAGEVRFSGTVYDTLAIPMESASLLLMGAYKYMVMGDVSEAYEVSAPAAGTFRIDLVVIGSDLVIDYVTGTAAATPVQPDTPSGHLLLGTILVPGECTEIIQTYLNRTYTVPAPAGFNITVTDDELSWAEPTTTITVEVRDQYCNALALGSGYGWYITLEFLYGNGTLTSADEGSSTTKIGQHAGLSGTSAEFTYTRDQLSTDSSPILQASLSRTGGDMVEITTITLLDNAGNIMP